MATRTSKPKESVPRWYNLMKMHERLASHEKPKIKKGDTVYWINTECGDWWNKHYETNPVLFRGTVKTKHRDGMVLVVWEPNEWTDDEDCSEVPMSPTDLYKDPMKCIQDWLQENRKELETQLQIIQEAGNENS